MKNRNGFVSDDLLLVGREDQHSDATGRRTDDALIGGVCSAVEFDAEPLDPFKDAAADMGVPARAGTVCHHPAKAKPLSELLVFPELDQGDRQGAGRKGALCAPTKRKRLTSRWAFSSPSGKAPGIASEPIAKKAKPSDSSAAAPATRNTKRSRSCA